MVLDAKDYALPQQRKRAWSVLIHAKSFNIARKEAARLCLEVLDKAVSLKVEPLPLHDFLLRQGNHFVKAELLRRQGQANAGIDRNADNGWIDLHQRFAASKGVSWSTMKPDAHIKNSKWFYLLPTREREIVTLWKQAVPSAESVDCSARIDRQSIGSGGILPTIVPGGKTFLLLKGPNKQPLNRILLGREALALQGYPVEKVYPEGHDDIPANPKLHDLAGNAFPTTVCLALFLATFACIPSRPSAEGETVADLRSLLDGDW